MTVIKRFLAFAHAWLLHAHQAYLRSGAQGETPQLPLIIVGAFRFGGSGKTPVAGVLAQRAHDRGIRVALITYQLNDRHFRKFLRHLRRKAPAVSTPFRTLRRVTPASDWREFSDESVMLAQMHTDVPGFVTHNRWLAWKELAATGLFDLVISDDGIMDSRLHNKPGVQRIVLMNPGEKIHRSQLWPVGKLRYHQGLLSPKDVIWVGPESMLTKKSEFGFSSQGAQLTFSREILLPPTFDKSKSWALICAIGNPVQLLSDLKRMGIKVTAKLLKRDHHAFEESELKAFSQSNPNLGLLCTAKDAVKLPANWRNRFTILSENISISQKALKSLISNETPSAVNHIWTESK